MLIRLGFDFKKTIAIRRSYFIFVTLVVIAVLKLSSIPSTSWREKLTFFQNVERVNTTIDQELRVIQRNLAHLQDFLRVRFDEISTESNKDRSNDLINNARLGSVDRIT